MWLPLQRLIAASILLGWLMPSLGALGLGVHLASEHHGHDRTTHEEKIANLLNVATFGHHHDLNAESDHRHDARLSRKALDFQTGLSLPATLPTDFSLSPPDTAGARCDLSDRRGQPRPHFTTHCALLL